MEWNRIEKKWLDMAVKLQAGTRLPKTGCPDALSGGQNDEGLKPDPDPILSRDDTNAPMTA